MFGIILLVVVIPAGYTIYHFLHNDKNINISEEDENDDEIYNNIEPLLTP